MCHDITNLPDNNDRKTLRKLIGDATIAIELGNYECPLADKDKAMEKLWSHIYKLAIRQSQWKKLIPAEFFLLESAILEKKVPFVYEDQIKTIIHDNKLEIDHHALKEFLT